MAATFDKQEAEVRWKDASEVSGQRSDLLLCAALTWPHGLVAIHLRVCPRRRQSELAPPCVPHSGPGPLLVWGLQLSQTGFRPWEAMFPRGSHVVQK